MDDNNKKLDPNNIQIINQIKEISSGFLTELENLKEHDDSVTFTEADENLDQGELYDLFDNMRHNIDNYLHSEKDQFDGYCKRLIKKESKGDSLRGKTNVIVADKAMVESRMANLKIGQDTVKKMENNRLTLQTYQIITGADFIYDKKSHHIEGYAQRNQFDKMELFRFANDLSRSRVQEEFWKMLETVSGEDSAKIAEKIHNLND